MAEELFDEVLVTDSLVGIKTARVAQRLPQLFDGCAFFDLPRKDMRIKSSGDGAVIYPRQV